MTRLLPALSALALSCGTFSAVAASPVYRPVAKPAIIGADRPVFLGSMVVAATPL
jgi:hypothetical protein